MEREVTEKGTVAAERVEQRRGLWPGGEGGPLVAEGGEALVQALGGGGVGGAGKHRRRSWLGQVRRVKA